MNLFIWMNGAAVCKSSGNSNGAGDFNVQSCSVVLDLVTNDEVYVVSGSGGNVLTTCYSCTAFSGFLIQPYL